MKNMADVMKAVQQRDGNALAKISSPAPPVSAPPTQQALAFFNDLFQQLSVVFPAMQAHIKSQADLDELRRQWIAAFKESGITSKRQVDAGMRRARQHELPYLPSPGQFIGWCHEETAIMIGLPQAEEVMKEFKRYCQDKSLYESPELFTWTSDIMYWLCTEMRHDMLERNLNRQEIEKLCDRLLRDWSKRLQAGEDIPPPVVRIENKARPQSTVDELGLGNEEVKKRGADMLARIRAKNGKQT